MSNAETITKYGYKCGLRSEAKDLPAGLAERMAEFPGKYIVYDPYDDQDGLCIVGSSTTSLN